MSGASRCQSLTSDIFPSGKPFRKKGRTDDFLKNCCTLQPATCPRVKTFSMLSRRFSRVKGLTT